MKRIKLAEIRETVGRHYGITRAEMVGPCRQRRYARPRQIAMYLSRELTQASTTKIGQYYGRRDHTTTIYACRSVARLMDADARLSADIAYLRSLLTGEYVITLTHPGPFQCDVDGLVISQIYLPVRPIPYVGCAQPTP